MIDIKALLVQPPLPLESATSYGNTTLHWAQRLSPSLILARNVAYGTHSSQRYDVFGAADKQLQPALIFWHGGGWTHGYKEWCAFMAAPIAQLGMRLVTPDYRLAPEHKLQAAHMDCLAAVAHFCVHAQEFGVDPSRIYLAGHSAGGHLALLTALRRTDAKAAGIPENAIQACLPISGILDLHHPQPAPGSLEEMVYSAVLEQPFDDAPMSPLCWGAGNTLPVVLTYGEYDSSRVRLSNQRMAALLALQPSGVQLYCEQGLDHFATHTSLNNADAPWYQRLSELLQSPL